MWVVKINVVLWAIFNWYIQIQSRYGDGESASSSLSIISTWTQVHSSAFNFKQVHSTANKSSKCIQVQFAFTWYVRYRYIVSFSAFKFKHIHPSAFKCNLHFALEWPWMNLNAPECPRMNLHIRHLLWFTSGCHYGVFCSGYRSS